MPILPQIPRKLLFGLVIAFLALTPRAVWAQGGGTGFTPRPKPPVPEFSFSLTVPSGSKTGEFVISAKIPKNSKGVAYHIYSMRSTPELNGLRATTVTLDAASPWELAGEFTPDHPAHPAKEPSIENPDDPSKLDPVEYYEKHVTWTGKVRLKGGASTANSILSGTLAYQICDNQGCRRPKLKFKVEPQVVDKVSLAEPAEGTVPPLSVPDVGQLPPVALPPLEAPNLPLAQANATPAPPRPLEKATIADAKAVGPLPERVAVKKGVINKSQGLFWFLVTAISFGFGALLTPCVFPMVPITISFFNKQAEKEHHRPVAMASVYCLGIMGTFTGMGMVMSALFGATSLNLLATNPWVNVFLGIVLVVFGLSLLGMFEMHVPSWLLTATSNQQGRGGYLGVLFMALTFTLTSFTCTFAFAGTLLVAAAQGDRLWPVLGLLAFSAAFSLPFFFLALFPSLLKKMPRSGGWMNVVKVVMGMIEVGAAFKFFSNADVGFNSAPVLFDFDVVVSAWMVISLVTAVYLLGLFRLPHDVETPTISVGRLVMSMSFLGLAAYLTMGLFAPTSPTGPLWRNIVALAPPRFEATQSGNSGTHVAVSNAEPRPEGPYLTHGGLTYALDVEKAIEFAVRENRPILLEFTGVLCTNCRLMEQGPMSRPDARARLSEMVRVQLYTDFMPKLAASAGVPDLTAEEKNRILELNRKIQEHWSEDAAIPSYVIVPPNPRLLADKQEPLDKFQGLEQSDGAFTQFLDKGLARWKLLQAGGRSQSQVQQATQLQLGVVSASGSDRTAGLPLAAGRP